MKVTQQTEFRRNLTSFIEEIFSTGEPLIVVTKRGTLIVDDINKDEYKIIRVDKKCDEK